MADFNRTRLNEQCETIIIVGDGDEALVAALEEMQTGPFYRRSYLREDGSWLVIAGTVAINELMEL